MKPVGRFAVIAGDGRRSTEWRIWTGRKNPSDDVYLTPRSLAGDFKVSLHKDGYAQHGPTEAIRRNLRAGERGAAARWRTVTADSDGTNVVYLLRFFAAELVHHPDRLSPGCWAIDLPSDVEGICLGIALAADVNALNRLPAQGFEVIGTVPRKTGVAAVVRLPGTPDSQLRTSILESLNEIRPPGREWKPRDPDSPRDLHGWIYSPDDSLVPMATELSAQTLQFFSNLSTNIRHNGLGISVDSEPHL